MSNPVTIQNHVYTGFTSGTEVISTSLALGIPSWVTVNIYEISDPDTLLTYNRISEQVFEVNHEAGLPANGTLVVALDVPIDELVREVQDGNVFKEETLKNLLLQAILASATVLEGRIPNALSPLDMNGFRVINVGNPTAPQDVVTRAYGDANYGGTAAADAEAAKADAEAAQSAAEDAQADAEAALASVLANVGSLLVDGTDTTLGKLTDKLAVSSNLTKVVTGGTNAVMTLDIADNTPFAMAGFDASGAFRDIFLGQGLVRDDTNLAMTFTGFAADAALDMDGEQITNVADPTDAQDVATKSYVDDNLSLVYVEDISINDSAGASITVPTGTKALKIFINLAKVRAANCNLVMALYNSGVKVTGIVQQSIGIHYATSAGSAQGLDDDNAILHRGNDFDQADYTFYWGEVNILTPLSADSMTKLNSRGGLAVGTTTPTSITRVYDCTSSAAWVEDFTNLGSLSYDELRILGDSANIDLEATVYAYK